MTKAQQTISVALLISSVRFPKSRPGIMSPARETIADILCTTALPITLSPTRASTIPNPNGDHPCCTSSPFWILAPPFLQTLRESTEFPSYMTHAYTPEQRKANTSSFHSYHSGHSSPLVPTCSSSSATVFSHSTTSQPRTLS
jgi:hypothetical protein